MENSIIEKYISKLFLLGIDQEIVDILKKGLIVEDDSLVFDGDLDLSSMNLTSLKFLEDIKEVIGYFDCENNNLTSLEGCPESVINDFDCECNNLTSLEGGPSSVGGHFYCENNQLTSLEGCPSSVGGHFYCDNNSKILEKPLNIKINGRFNN